MTKINEIINAIEKIAPLSKQEEWDNSGWQIRLQKNDIKRVMLCVSVTESVLNQAIEKNCDMIISHHPMFFNNFENPVKNEIIRNHLPVYSIHTPFDKAKLGTTDMLIKTCGFEFDEVINEYTKIVNYEIPLKILVEKVKQGLNIDKLRISNYDVNKIVKKIAFCAGSGTSFFEDVENSNCDCFITADLKFHTALDSKLTIIDVGHLESEKPALQTIKETLDFVECEIAEETSSIQIV